MKRQQQVETREQVYRLIEDWCANNPGSGATLGLMRLVLSLYNGRCWSFSIPICIRSLDNTRLQWAKSIILDYFDRGETDELLRLARKFASKVKESQ